MRVQKNVLPLQRRTYQVRRCKKVSAAKNTTPCSLEGKKRTFFKRKDTSGSTPAGVANKLWILI